MQITRQQWWLIGAAAVGVLVLISLVIVFVNVRRGSRLVVDVDPRVQSERRIERAQTNCPLSQDESDCLFNTMVEEARAMEDAHVCEGLADESQRTDCVRLVALATLEADQCQVLAGDARAACRDSAFSAKAQQEVNLAVCQRVQGSSAQETCKASVTATIVSRGACAEHPGVDMALCNQREIASRALSERSVVLCEQLATDEDVAGCVSAVNEAIGDDGGDNPDTDQDGLPDRSEPRYGTDINNPDSDGDGLRDGEEVSVYGTEPLNPDTDSDGFSDGEEVQNGYNPAGPGAL